MPKEKNNPSKDDPEYLAKRAKNNEAIKRSREKARQKASETKEKVDALKSDNKELEDKITALGQEMKFLKDVFIAHASNSSNGAASSTAAPSTTVVSGGIPAPPSASASGVDGEVKEEQSDDFLTDLLAQLDPPPGPS